MQDNPTKFQWLADLAAEVNELSGFYKNDETAAVYCPNCQIIQAYCTGCGEKLIDVYDEETDCCENCGISLSHCCICGHTLEEQTIAPDNLEKPEYWKYCPACGEPVFAVTDMCQHCKVSMGAHLDAVYAATIDRVSEVTVAEEMQQAGEGKSKNLWAKPVIPDHSWYFSDMGNPYRFVTKLSVEECIKIIDHATIDTKAQHTSAAQLKPLALYHSDIQYYGVEGYATITRTFFDFRYIFGSGVKVWLADNNGTTEVIIRENSQFLEYLVLILATIVSGMIFVALSSIEGVIVVIILWILLNTIVQLAFRRSKLLCHIRLWLSDTTLKS